jgi:hypothetical protein
MHIEGEEYTQASSVTFPTRNSRYVKNGTSADDVGNAVLPMAHSPKHHTKVDKTALSSSWSCRTGLVLRQNFNVEKILHAVRIVLCQFWRWGLAGRGLRWDRTAIREGELGGISFTDQAHGRMQWAVHLCGAYATHKVCTPGFVFVRANIKIRIGKPACLVQYIFLNQVAVPPVEGGIRFDAV